MGIKQSTNYVVEQEPLYCKKDTRDTVKKILVDQFWPPPLREETIALHFIRHSCCCGHPLIVLILD